MDAILCYQNAFMLIIFVISPIFKLRVSFISEYEVAELQ